MLYFYLLRLVQIHMMPVSWMPASFMA